MKVTDILRVKGNMLYTVLPDTVLAEAVKTMSDLDNGSMVAMEHGDLVGMLSIHDVANTVLEAQDLANRMLKKFIRNWPAEVTSVSNE